MDKRYTFNQETENYNKLRPTYPTELFETIMNYSNITKDSVCLEIGIGTGQATPPFLNKEVALDAVELGQDLAQHCKEKFKDYKKFNIYNSDFESVELTNNYDLIFSATAFHWIDIDQGLLKVKKLLKENGTVALFWNVPYPAKNNPVLYDEIQELYKKLRPNAKPYKPNPGFHYTQYLEALQKHNFKDIQKHTFESQRVLTAHQYVQLLNTYSDHIALDNNSKKWFEEEITKLINNHNGTITINDTVELYMGKK